MKFTEEKLEKAEIMVNGQLLMVNEWNLRTALTINHYTFTIQMSSFPLNKLDILKM